MEEIDKRKTQEPTVGQLKEMISQLTQENEQLKDANRQAIQALDKYKSLLAYTIEMCHDKEMLILHEKSMANAAMRRRNPGTE